MAAFEPLWLPFDHPLWIVYSSGTTGLPNPSCTAHGGIVLVAMVTGLHMDLGASYAANSLGERFCWYSSTGWVMWNCQVAGLLSGTTCVIFDGSPRRAAPGARLGVLWRFAARHRVTFQRGRGLHAGCMKAGWIWPPAATCRACARWAARLAAVGRGAGVGQRAVRSHCRHPGAKRTSGGSTSRAAPILLAASSAARLSCRSAPA